MATETQPASAHATGRAFAQAYASADFGAVEALLDPDVHYRELTPRKTVDTHGVAPVVDEAREFLAGYDSHETVELATGQVGRRAWARTRWLLHDGGETSVVEWCQYMTVEDGRVTAFEVVCSGPMRVQ